MRIPRIFTRRTQTSTQIPTIDLVREFHETYHVPVRTTPSLDVPERELRYELLREELEELRTALDDDDLTETFDALLDIIWVAYGAILTFGFPFNEGINEVARSNRTKLGLDGLPIFRESDNKVMKGPNFSPPDLVRILEHAAQNNTTSGG